MWVSNISTQHYHVVVVLSLLSWDSCHILDISRCRWKLLYSTTPGRPLPAWIANRNKRIFQKRQCPNNCSSGNCRLRWSKTLHNLYWQTLVEGPGGENSNDIIQELVTNSRAESFKKLILVAVLVILSCPGFTPRSFLFWNANLSETMIVVSLSSYQQYDFVVSLRSRWTAITGGP